MSFVDKFVRLTLGFALFIPIDFVVVASSAALRSPVAGAVFALLTGALAYLFYRKGMPWYGAGLALGFAVMTIVTGGTCTLFTRSDNYGEFGGLWYLMLTIALLIVAGIAKVFSPRSADPTGKQQ